MELGDRKGWRLPTIEELSSLVDPSEEDPALPDGHSFTNVKSAHYWSISTIPGYPDDAWVLDFCYGSVGHGDKTSTNYVRCVRGGHGHDGW